MHPVIKEILDSSISNKEKVAEIEKLKASINIIEKILNGEFTYCKKCGDYYLSKCFFQDSETVKERICIYSDPINSGGDEYRDGQVKYTYMCCPKGCKHMINREEIFISI